MENNSIIKIKSFKTNEGTFSVYDTDRSHVGREAMFTVLEDPAGWVVRNALVPEEIQNKGIATEFYKRMNAASIAQTGKPLRSSPARNLISGEKVHELSSAGARLWDSLVTKGLAEKLNDKDYRFITKTSVKETLRYVCKTLAEAKKPEFEPPYYSEKDRMDYFKDRKKGGSDLPKDILKLIEIEKVGDLFHMKVLIVNGEVMRNEVDIDFSVSGEEEIYVTSEFGDVFSCTIEELHNIWELSNKKDKFKVLSLNIDDVTYSWEYLNDVIKHKTVEPLMEITTRCGRTIKATQSHSFLTVDDDGNIVKIKPSEMSVNHTIIPIIGNMDSHIINSWQIPEYKNWRLLKTVYDKIELTKNFGFFIGLYLAEGSLAKGNISFACMEANIREKIIESIKEIGLHACIVNDTAICCSNRQLAAAINTDFFCGSSKKKIAPWILASPKEFREGLIDGYWSGDGSILRRKGSKSTWATAGTDSKDLAYGIQLILASLGIQSTIKKNNRIPKGFKNPNTVHYVITIGASGIGRLPNITHVAKNNNRKIFTEPHQDSITIIPVPKNLTIRTFRAKGKKGYTGYANAFRHINEWKDTDKLYKLGSNNVLWDLVVGIKEVPIEEYTYDLSINHNKTFVLANGITVHNTTGGNPARYAYNPDDEIWIEKTFGYSDFAAVLIHEFVESVFMAFKGLSYDDAHDQANIAEGDFRKKIVKGEEKIKDYTEAIEIAKDAIIKHFKDKKINLEKLLSKDMKKIKIKESQLQSIHRKLNEEQENFAWYYTWMAEAGQAVNKLYSLLIATNVSEVMNNEINLTNMENKCYSISTKAYEQYKKAYSMIDPDDEETDQKLDDAHAVVIDKLDVVQDMINALNGIKKVFENHRAFKLFSDIETKQI